MTRSGVRLLLVDALLDQFGVAVKSSNPRRRQSWYRATIKGGPMRRALVGAVGVIGLVVVAVLSAYAVAAPKGPTKRSFTGTTVGAEISAKGGSSEEVFKVVNSLDGTCAAIAHNSETGTSFPIHGTSAVTTYCANGVLKEKLEYALHAPNASGVITYTGSGTCLARIVQ